MINIRSNCFETNSSSTHSLVIKDEHSGQDNTTEDVFNKQYIIYPFTESIYKAEYTTIEDKLRYFLTIYYQGDEYHMSLMQQLSKMFPNALFIHDFRSDDCYGPHPYIFEDSEYYAEHLSFTEDELRDFMLNGTVYFGNRDNENFYDFTHYDVKKNSKFYCCWSG